MLGRRLPRRWATASGHSPIGAAGSLPAARAGGVEEARLSNDAGTHRKHSKGDGAVACRMRPGDGGDSSTYSITEEEKGKEEGKMSQLFWKENSCIVHTTGLYITRRKEI